MNSIYGRIATSAAATALTFAAHAQVPASATLARNLAAQCANCHGTNGRSLADVPSLAGQSAGVLIAKLNDYRSGKQAATIMHQLSKGYTDDQIALMADYFSKQPK